MPLKRFYYSQAPEQGAPCAMGWGRTGGPQGGSGGRAEGEGGLHCVPEGRVAGWGRGRPRGCSEWGHRLWTRGCPGCHRLALGVGAGGQWPEWEGLQAGMDSGLVSLTGKEPEGVTYRLQEPAALGGAMSPGSARPGRQSIRNTDG